MHVALVSFAHECRFRDRRAVRLEAGVGVVKTGNCALCDLANDDKRGWQHSASRSVCTEAMNIRGVAVEELGALIVCTCPYECLKPSTWRPLLFCLFYMYVYIYICRSIHFTRSSA